MTKEERELQQNIVRVGFNLGALLDMGLFPGKHALGLEECKGFVKSIIDNAQAKLQMLEPAPSPETNGKPADVKPLSKPTA